MQGNLKKRIITALLIYPLIVFCILHSNELVVRMILNIIIFLSAFEISKMCFYNNLHVLSVFAVFEVYRKFELASTDEK